VLGEKFDEGRLCVEAEGVVGEVDSVEVGKGEESAEEMLQCGWDFGEKAGCEDVCEVCDLRDLQLANV
jgi:hypothetical protein